MAASASIICSFLAIVSLKLSAGLALKDADLDEKLKLCDFGDRFGFVSICILLFVVRIVNVVLFDLVPTYGND